jgi:predicted acetyltransferase
VPSHRGKGVEECLLGLALKYCKSKQATIVTIKYDEPNIVQYQRDTLTAIITEKFGFIRTGK